MKIAILGTGIVGRTLAGKLSKTGHNVIIGTRDVSATLAKTEIDAMGNEPFAKWNKNHPDVKLNSFNEAALSGDIVINATSGSGSLEALKLAGESNLNGKILIDISNPLDFSRGMPPTLFISNTDSLGEQTQKLLPGVKVVKALNTISASIMINPAIIAGGDHTLFICGNDAQAKNSVTGYLKDWFGWKDIIDLGDITNARGTEMYLPLWVRIWGVLNTPNFSIKVVK